MLKSRLIPLNQKSVTLTRQEMGPRPSQEFLPNFGGLEFRPTDEIMFVFSGSKNVHIKGALRCLPMDRIEHDKIIDFVI